MFASPRLRAAAYLLLCVGLGLHLPILINALQNAEGITDAPSLALVWAWILSPYAVGIFLVRFGRNVAAAGWTTAITTFDIYCYERYLAAWQDGVLAGFIPLGVPLVNWLLVGPLGAASAIGIASILNRIAAPSNISLQRDRDR
jgi:hypothetical protein